MNRIQTRRRLASTTLILVIVAVSAWLGSRALALRDVAYLSGWLLMSVMVFLALFNIRKKFTYPPLISGATWLQMHLYMGNFSLFLFLVHVGFSVPNGGLELAIAALFLMVVISGIYGIFLSRYAAPRLTVAGQEVIYERIPVFIRGLREEAEGLVIEASRETHSATLPDFVRGQVMDFLYAPRDYWRQMAQAGGRSHWLRAELKELYRYFSDGEKQLADRLDEILVAKDKLDYHHAMQTTLKAWLFFHIPATYGLLVMVAVHMVLVHAFGGGLS